MELRSVRKHDSGKTRVGVDHIVFVPIVVQVAFGVSDPEDPTTVAGMLRLTRPPMLRNRKVILLGHLGTTATSLLLLFLSLGRLMTTICGSITLKRLKDTSTPRK